MGTNNNVGQARTQQTRPDLSSDFRLIAAVRHSPLCLRIIKDNSIDISRRQQSRCHSLGFPPRYQEPDFAQFRQRQRQVHSLRRYPIVAMPRDRVSDIAQFLDLSTGHDSNDHSNKPYQFREDIKTCQSQGKTIILSIGGATYTEGGFSSPAEASSWANTIWAMFGPEQSGSSVNRPFGSAVIDGFDIDVEAVSANLAAFASQLRSNMDSAATNTKKYILSAAPQCPFPDLANQDMLNAVKFDYVAVQFYNNYCGVNSYVPGASTQNNFNFETWDNWAKTTSKNPNVKILLGIPGSSSAAGSGYVSGSQLSSVIAYSKGFSSFGGVMVWDMSQVFNNNGFLDTIASALGNGGGPGATNPATTTRPQVTTTLTTITTTRPPTTTTTPGTGQVPQWGQCGGKGYVGPTECVSPFKCTALSEWWSQCE